MTTEEARKILKVDEGLSKEEVKKAYNKRALETHPDLNGGDDEEIKKVNEAYEVLSKRSNLYYHKHNVRPDFGFKWVFDQIRRRRQRWRAPQHDNEIGLGLEISLDRIKKGEEFTLQYEQSEECKDCHGIGGKEKNGCTLCEGRGFTMHEVDVDKESYWSAAICKDCHGVGFIVIEPCNSCGDGFVTVYKSITFEVKEKK